MTANKVLHKRHLTLKATCSASSVKWLLHHFLTMKRVFIFFSFLFLSSVILHFSFGRDCS